MALTAVQSKTEMAGAKSERRTKDQISDLRQEIPCFSDAHASV